MPFNNNNSRRLGEGITQGLISSGRMNRYDGDQCNPESRLSEVFFSTAGARLQQLEQQQEQQEYKSQIKTLRHLFSDLLPRKLKQLKAEEKKYLRQLADISGLDAQIRDFISNQLVGGASPSVESPDEYSQAVTTNELLDCLCDFFCRPDPYGSYYNYALYDQGWSDALNGNVNLFAEILSPNYQGGVFDEQAMQACCEITKACCHGLSALADACKGLEIKCEEGCEYVVGLITACCAAIADFIKKIMHLICHAILHVSSVEINRRINEGKEIAHYAFYVLFFIVAVRLFALTVTDLSSINAVWSRETFCISYSIAIGALEYYLGWHVPAALADYKHMMMMSSLLLLTTLHPHVKTLQPIASFPYRWLNDVKAVKEKFNLNVYGSSQGVLLSSQDLMRCFNDGVFDGKSIDDITQWLDDISGKRDRLNEVKQRIRAPGGCCPNTWTNVGRHLVLDENYLKLIKSGCLGARSAEELEQAEDEFNQAKNPNKFFDSHPVSNADSWGYQSQDQFADDIETGNKKEY